MNGTRIGSIAYPEKHIAPLVSGDPGSCTGEPVERKLSKAEIAENKRADDARVQRLRQTRLS